MVFPSDVNSLYSFLEGHSLHEHSYGILDQFKFALFLTSDHSKDTLQNKERKNVCFQEPHNWRHRMTLLDRKSDKEETHILRTQAVRIVVKDLQSIPLKTTKFLRGDLEKKRHETKISRHKKPLTESMTTVIVTSDCIMSQRETRRR
jgi:hypothetical protein